MSQDWRIETDARDYLTGQKKQAEVENRRPIVRKPADLVGPGIGASAIKITDWSDALATYNGYFSSQPGANAAPNAIETFVGITSMDDVIGGWQLVTGMASNVTYKRTFLRNPADPSTIVFSAWKSDAVAVVSDYAARYYATTNTSLAAGTFNVVPLPAKSYDNSNGAFANGSYTCPRDGFLSVHYGIALNSGVSSAAIATVFINGNEASRGSDSRPGSGGYSYGSSGSDDLPVKAGDNVVLRAYVSTAAAIYPGSPFTRMACRMR